MGGERGGGKWGRGGDDWDIVSGRVRKGGGGGGGVTEREGGTEGWLGKAEEGTHWRMCG